MSNSQDECNDTTAPEDGEQFSASVAGGHPYTIMAVCTGNICRSPMAEIILNRRFKERGLADRVRVISSGVSDEEHGHPIDPRAVRVLRADGYAIPEDHFAHRITHDEIAQSDLFLPMTWDHMRALLPQLPTDKRADVHLYRSFDPGLPQPAPGHEYEIDLVDPWYGGPHEFQVAIDQIDEVAPFIVDWVSRELERQTEGEAGRRR